MRSRAQSVMSSGVTRLLTRLVVECDGQDLVEYALLVGFIALAVAAGFNAIASAIATSYAAWDGGSQALGACTPDPGGGGC